MVFCNLSNQGETQSDAALGTGLARRSVEGLEDPLTFRFRDARPAVGDDEADTEFATKRHARVSPIRMSGHEIRRLPMRGVSPVEWFRSVAMVLFSWRVPFVADPRILGAI